MNGSQKRKRIDESSHIRSTINTKTSNSLVDRADDRTTTSPSSSSPNPRNHISQSPDTHDTESLSNQQQHPLPSSPPIDINISPSNPPDKPSPNPRIQALNSQILTLEDTNTALQAQLSSKLAELRSILPPPTSLQSSISPAESTSDIDARTLSQAEHVTKKHIQMLTRYNEIKDVGMFLIGLVAEKDGKRVVEVMEDYGVCDDD